MTPGTHGRTLVPKPPRAQNEEELPASKGWELYSGEIRRRPTLPGTHVPSTIGAIALNFRVRNGNGCDHDAKATETSCLVWRFVCI